jgi:O-antigen ligase
VVAGAFFVGVLAFGNGWFARAESTTAPGASASDIGTGRTERFREALRLVKKEPIFGVGPGRYTIALESVPYGELLPAHDAMLHEAAEAGVVGGVLTAALLLALALDACRAGANTMIVFGSILMFFLVDSYPYVFPAGIAFAGLWLGLQHLASEPLPAHD